MEKMRQEQEHETVSVKRAQAAANMQVLPPRRHREYALVGQAAYSKMCSDAKK